VRAFLNIEVTQLLAVNCFCESSISTYWNYKCIIERYEFLEHMPFKISDVEHPALVGTRYHYDASAFGSSEFINRISDE
jgi:hypothetical protein